MSFWYKLNLKRICNYFKNKGQNEINEKLLKRINENHEVYMVPSKIDGTFFIRFCVCAATTEKSHIDKAWNVIIQQTKGLLEN